MIEFPPMPTGEEVHRCRALTWADGNGEALSLREARERLVQEREKAILYGLLNATDDQTMPLPEVIKGLIRFLLEKYR